MQQKERFFMFGATYCSNDGDLTASNFGVIRESFPKCEDLTKVVQKFNATAHKIVILSICELTKEDYEHFFS